MSDDRIKYEDVREGDRLALSGVVEATPSAGLGVRIGDHLIPLRDMAKADHRPLIRVGDWIRPKGSSDLVEGDCAIVTGFVDDAGKACERGRYVVARPEAISSGSHPTIFAVHSIERIPLSEAPKGKRL